MVLTPLFGFWLASSLAAYHNATQWLSLLVGLLLFPILPVGWDLVFVWRRSRKAHPPKQILTRLDRLVLRTLLVNGVFLGGMLYARPHAAFRAIAVRGDWMLDGFEGEAVDAVRGVILRIADRFEHRWHHHGDTYGKTDESPTPAPSSTPSATGAWPMNPAVDVQVKEMPELGSVDEVGKYLAARITDQRRLVKALHDYVDLRLTYDRKAYGLIMAKDWEHVPSQEADAVFAARTGVCAGYSHLLAALGKAAGVNILYITGYARDSQQQVPENNAAALQATLEGYAHAWNAAYVDGQWVLIDATWDDPEDPAAPPRSTYLFTPPDLFVYQHLPDLDSWQLLDKKVTPGDFVRQPLMTPESGALGIKLREPARSQVTADGELRVELDNSQHVAIAADVAAPGTHGGGKNCIDLPTTEEHVAITCKIEPGQWEVRLFGGRGERSLDYIGSIQVNGR